MDKTKKQILLFIVIILIGAFYTINEYIMVPKKLLIQQKAKEMQVNKQKLNLLKSKNDEFIQLNAEVAELKQVANSIGEFTVTEIDTPQLIFDFYISCKNFGIKGENLIFQLADTNTKMEVPINKTEDTNNSNIATDLLKLTIELRVSGDKNKVEKYIRSLNTLTSRKINVKSIKLEAVLGPMFDNDGVTDIPIVPNTSVSPGSEVLEEPVTNRITADIVFNQYIYSNGKNVIHPSNYGFFDGEKGFSNFSDMFK